MFARKYGSPERIYEFVSLVYITKQSTVCVFLLICEMITTGNWYYIIFTCYNHSSCFIHNSNSNNINNISTRDNSSCNNDHYNISNENDVNSNDIDDKDYHHTIIGVHFIIMMIIMIDGEYNGNDW